MVVVVAVTSGFGIVVAIVVATMCRYMNEQQITMAEEETILTLILHYERSGTVCCDG